MSDTCGPAPASPGPDYSEAGQQRLRDFVTHLTGGRIVRWDRLVRWRPAWFVDVEQADGSLLKLHLRGDRGGDVSIFPDLKREADVIDVLRSQGIAVPRIHGYCSNPPCIVMDAIAGTRDMAQARDDTERSAIAREYIAEVAKMHRLSPQPFVERGLHLPQGAQAIALAGLNAYLPLYRRTKCKPEPFLEFVLGWIRRNVPQHRTEARFIQFDSGQFLFENGRLTQLYDFEFSMIGDPMMDLATMRMRDNVEPLGDNVARLLRHYEEVSGAPVDRQVIEFHTLQFATISTMQFAGTVGRPRPGDPHAVYLEFDIALRQVILQAMTALTGIRFEPEPAPRLRTGDQAAVLAALADTVQAIATDDPVAASQKEAADKLIEWLARSDAFGQEMRQRNLADVSALLGRRLDEWADAEAALEAHVLQAPPSEDERLLRLFAAIEGRRMLVHGPTRIGRSAEHVNLPPLH